MLVHTCLFYIHDRLHGKMPVQRDSLDYHQISVYRTRFAATRIHDDVHQLLDNLLGNWDIRRERKRCCPRTRHISRAELRHAVHDLSVALRVIILSATLVMLLATTIYGGGRLNTFVTLA